MENKTNTDENNKNKNEENKYEIFTIKDEYLEDYLKFKREYLKTDLVYGVKFNKNDTQKYVKILKQFKPPYKNFNPIKHSNNSNDNIYLTKFDSFNKENKLLLEKELSSLDTKFEITEEKISLNINNYSYEEIFKFFIEEEISKKKINNNNSLLKNIPNGFEIVGKIAHLNLRDEYLPYKYFIGQLILDKNISIKTVINKIGKIDNVFRTYEMEILAGEINYTVEHKEGSVKFKFDLRKTYWCSRLQNERDRILNLIKKNEILCDAFCGVGPLSLRACKKGIKVFANDLNPCCYEYINNNIKLNKLDKNLIKTYNMDAREFIKELIELTKKNIDEDEINADKIFPKDVHIDHIYMNLPKDAIEFLDVYIGLFKNCKENIYNKNNLPMIHVYGFAKCNNDPHLILKKRIAKAFKMDYNLFEKECEKDIVNIEDVRDISNNKMVYCVEMKIPNIVAYGLYTEKEYNDEEEGNKENDDEGEEDDE